MFFLTYQTPDTSLPSQATVMMDEKRLENQTEELDSSTLKENSQETSENGSAPAVSVSD